MSQDKEELLKYFEMQRSGELTQLVIDEIADTFDEEPLFCEKVRRDMEACCSNPHDGYHTMDELYHYRMLYNALAANWMPHMSVKSWHHSDGELCFGGGWFVVYLMLPTGQVSNHYAAQHWDLFHVPEVDRAPEYDGHTPQQAATRIESYLFDTYRYNTIAELAARRD